jgi:pSer/pThr/pTyr-binding forkhead associated (FHA) protein
LIRASRDIRDILASDPVRLRFRIRTGPSAESGELVDRVVDVEPAADEVRIGRKAGVEIQLPFTTVSSLHARVFKHGDGWALVDMGSSNGTFVGQVRLGSGQPRVIKPGEIFRLADVTVAFEGEVGAVAGDKPAKTESTATLARRLVNDLFQAVAGAEIARVVVEKGPSTGQSVALSLPDRAYKVGRAPDCDLVLSDDDVSREHAAFERRWQGVFVRDLGSKNGLEIDGKKVRGEQRVHDGELITLGASQLRIDDPEERYLRQMEADAREAPKKTAPAAPAVPAAAAAPAVKEAPAAPPAPKPAAAPAAAAKPEPAPAPAAKPSDKPADDKAKSDPPKADKPAAKPDDKAGAGDADKKKAAEAAAKPAAVAKAKEPARPAKKSDKDPPKGSRVLPFFVTLFSLAVLGGVGYLVWVIFFGMGSPGR